MISTSQLEVSSVTAKIGNTDAKDIVDDGADARAKKVIKCIILAQKQTYCYICGKPQSKVYTSLKNS